MAEGGGVELKKSLQQGIEDNMLDGYYDIMVIGRIGMGKSTTVDKLLIANMTGQSDQDQQSKSDQGKAHKAKCDIHKASGNSQSGETQDSDPVKAGDVSELEGLQSSTQAPNHTLCKDLEHGKLSYDDMTMWMVSDKDYEVDRVSMRLKNLVYFSSLEEPHKHVSSSYAADMHIFSPTGQCELYSNDLTKVRVLDVPGFFGQSDDKNNQDRFETSGKASLQIMRKIIRIRSAYNLVFRRVIYFLPDRGALKRAGYLTIEIDIMAKYFGRAIFDSMIVVATHSPETYRFAQEGVNFPSDMLEETRKYLTEALGNIFTKNLSQSGEAHDNDPQIQPEVPNPPIVFISLFDTCEEILLKVQQAEVKEEKLQLKFSDSNCTRCGAKIRYEGKEDLASSCTYPGESGSVPHDESMCHPLMIPKYAEIMKILGGIAHIITLRRFIGKWPNFSNMDEKCIECEGSPNSRGCCKVGSQYFYTKEKKGKKDKEDTGLTVGHSTNAKDLYVDSDIGGLSDDSETKSDKKDD